MLPVRINPSLSWCAAQVIGLVTRKDLTEPNAKLVLGRKANLGLAAGATDALVRSETLPFIPYGAPNAHLPMVSVL